MSCNSKTQVSRNGIVIESCERCGTHSVSLGPLTIRLDSDALQNLQQAIGEVLRREKQEQEPQTPSHVSWVN